jgi:hypothetical protein
MLESSSIDPNLTDVDGSTFFHSIHEPVEENVQAVIDDGRFALDMKNAFGDMPFVKAAREGDHIVVKLLLRTGKVSVETENDEGSTPPMETMRSPLSKLETVARQLHTGKINIESVTPLGESTMMLAERQLEPYGRIEEEEEEEKELYAFALKGEIDVARMVLTYLEGGDLALLQLCAGHSARFPGPSVESLKADDVETCESLWVDRYF